MISGKVGTSGKVSKLRYMYVIGLKWIFFFFSNFNEKFWNKSTLIWVGFLGLRFYPYFNETTSLKTIPSFEFAYISCILYTWLLWAISVLTKNLSRRKSLYKIIFKSVHVDTPNIYCSKPVTLFWRFYC